MVVTFSGLPQLQHCYIYSYLSGGSKGEEFLNARGKDMHFLKLTMCKILNIILVSTRSIAFLKQVKASMTRNKTR